jgi:mannose/fructose-specific phosphotransferase system component IIA
MPTFAEEMVAQLETLLRENVGVQTVTFGGQTVSYADLQQQYQRWKAQAARETGKRPFIRSLTMEGP